MLLMMDLCVFVNVCVGAVVNIPVTTVTNSSSSISRPLSEPTAVVRLVDTFRVPPPSGSNTSSEVDRISVPQSISCWSHVDPFRKWSRDV